MAGIAEPPFGKPVDEQGERLGRGELGANAGPGPGAERQVLKAMTAALPGEPFDVEGIGINPELAVPVEDPRPDRDDVARPYFPITQSVGADRLAIALAGNKRAMGKITWIQACRA